MQRLSSRPIRYASGTCPSPGRSPSSGRQRRANCYPERVRSVACISDRRLLISRAMERSTVSFGSADNVDLDLRLVHGLTVEIGGGLFEHEPSVLLHCGAERRVAVCQNLDRLGQVELLAG